jgi:carbon-monoxide dehydrogenase small subunit
MRYFKKFFRSFSERSWRDMGEFVTLTVNRKEYVFSVGDAFGQLPYNETLLHTLRNRLGLTGSKASCGEGACGCCTVILNGKPVTSCILLTVEYDGANITTIEGLQDPKTGELHPIQQAFIDVYAFQCGYCTPGIIMVTKALLDSNPKPSKSEIDEALSGNYCRCISQYHVFEAIDLVVERMNGGAN